MALTISAKEPSNSRLVQTDQAGHWYTQEGDSAHSIIGANGKERNTTVADARKLGLLPSVTSVQSILEKPQLTAWKISTAVESALTLPKEENETLEDYARRIVEDSKAQTKKAAEHGTALHTEMENILLGRACSTDEVLKPFIETFRKWASENIEETYWCEKALVGAGYAGRCDAYVKLRDIGDAIIDLKNRKINKKYNTPPFYPTDGQQLWAYRNASENPKCACVSVVLGSNDSEYIKHHQWDEDELYQSGIAFQAMLKIWCWVKGYTPPGCKL